MTATADNTARTQAVDAKATAERTVFGILIAISVAHGLNDIIQSLIPAIYPMLKDEFRLDFGQIGLITLAFQLTASLLQPLVGLYTDQRPQPYSLAAGMGFTLVGLLLLSRRAELPPCCSSPPALVGIGLVGLPPRILARGAHGVGRAARARAVALPGRRQRRLGARARCWPRSSWCRAGSGSIAWFSVAALVGDRRCCGGSAAGTSAHRRADGTARAPSRTRRCRRCPARRVVLAHRDARALIFSKYFYLASLTSYYTFYLIDRFGVSVQNAQIHPVRVPRRGGGRHHRRRAGRRPLRPQVRDLVLDPRRAAVHARAALRDLFWTGVLSVVIGLILASAFSAILVYAQELVPGRVGMVSGCSSASPSAWAASARRCSASRPTTPASSSVYKVCSFLPALGLLTALIPNLRTMRR